MKRMWIMIIFVLNVVLCHYSLQREELSLFFRVQYIVVLYLHTYYFVCKVTTYVCVASDSKTLTFLRPLFVVSSFFSSSSLMLAPLYAVLGACSQC